MYRTRLDQKHISQCTLTFRAVVVHTQQSPGLNCHFKEILMLNDMKRKSMHIAHLIRLSRLVHEFVIARYRYLFVFLSAMKIIRLCHWFIVCMTFIFMYLFSGGRFYIVVVECFSKTFYDRCAAPATATLDQQCHPFLQSKNNRSQF